MTFPSSFFIRFKTRTHLQTGDLVHSDAFRFQACSTTGFCYGPPRLQSCYLVLAIIVQAFHLNYSVEITPMVVSEFIFLHNSETRQSG